MEVDAASPLFSGREMAETMVSRTFSRGFASKLNQQTGISKDAGIGTERYDFLGLESQPIRVLETTPLKGVEVPAWLLNRDYKRLYPAAYTNRYGKGKVVFFPMDLGGMYSVTSWPQWRILMENAVRFAESAPPSIYAVAPHAVQFEPTFQPEQNRYVVHLLNDSLQSLVFLNEARRVRQDIPPIAGVQVVVRGVEVKEPYAEPAHEKLPVRYENGNSIITVPALKDHMMIVWDK